MAKALGDRLAEVQISVCEIVLKKCEWIQKCDTLRSLVNAFFVDRSDPLLQVEWPHDTGE